jgi:hypothetical protein
MNRTSRADLIVGEGEEERDETVMEAGVVTGHEFDGAGGREVSTY